MDFGVSDGWVLRGVEAEDPNWDGCISVGGLYHKLGLLKPGGVVDWAGWSRVTAADLDRVLGPEFEQPAAPRRHTQFLGGTARRRVYAPIPCRGGIPAARGLRHCPPLAGS